MTAQLSPVPVFKAFDNNGQPLAGGLLYSYIAGTSTPQVTYTDSTQSTSNTNPIVLNARGECALWLGTTLTYKLQLTDSLGNTIPGFPVDNIPGGFGALPIGTNLIPAITNTYTLGNSSFSWANLYLGPNAIPVFNTISGNIGFYSQTQAEITLGVTPVNNGYPPGNAWRFLSAAQIADVQGGTLLQDCTTALQNWLNCAFLGNISAYLPGGAYLTSGTLIINKADAASEYRGDGFTVYGDGSGPAFDTADTRTSLLYSVTNSVILRYEQYLGSGTTSGNYYVRGIRFIQNSSSCTVPVVQLDVLGEYSVFERCDVFQAGTGDGIRCLQMTKATIQFCNVLNRDWPTAVLGAGRVGCGINIFDQYNAGLGCIRKCTSRGFLDGYILGYGNFDLGPFLIEDNEASVTYRGLTIGALTSKTLVSHCYFEGQELTCITDGGKYTSIRDCELQPNTWTTGIDGSAQGGGAFYDGNQVGMSPALSSVTGININGSASLLATVSNNYIIWGSSGTGLSNVIGLQLSGVNAMINHHANMFNPNSGWSGATNCHAISDLTTSSTGSSGTGTRGFGVQEDGSTVFPRMTRGAFGLWKNATALGNTALSSGVLTLGNASYVVWNPTSGTLSVTSISGGACEEGHIYKLRIVNGTGNNLTITNGANLRIGTANIVQANSTTWTYEFFMDDNAAWLNSTPVQNI